VIGVGYTLQPDTLALDLLEPWLADEVDYFEVAPETLWYETPDGGLHDNAFHQRVLGWASACGKPFVGHGVGYPLCGVGSAADARCERWLTRLERERTRFDFLWYTDHLGVACPDGEDLRLPLPVPMSELTVATLRARLALLERAAPHVGVENTANHFVLGDPLDEARLLSAATRAPRAHLLLDLHNLYAMSLNLKFDADAYLAALDLSAVIEIHVSGGSDSDPRWLPSGARVRLDGHDAAVPEAVWALLARVVPRCAHLRGVTLERMEGTVDASELPALRAELRRIRALVAA
jgi:uncharacterized protein (UPF0276 family)